MKKLKYLAKDFSANSLDKNNIQYYEVGYTAGFKKAFSFIQEQLKLEADKLKEWPMMNERMAAITKMQETLNRLFEEVTDENY